jgi:putative peptidoglycan lipid II flippase
VQPAVRDATCCGGLQGVGATSYLLGLAIGEVRSRGGELEALAEPSTGPAAPGGGGGPIDLRASAQIRDFDPSPPGDGREAPGAVGNAFDGDPTTAWETERYATPELGGLKPGVGLLVDLGAPTPITTVELGLRPGTTVELRAADEVGLAVADFPVVTTAAETGEVVRLDAGGRAARYWLVVLTRLPAERGGFRGAVSDLLFVRG